MRFTSNHTVVITGAASGIGRALAERAAARGCALALVDLDQRGLSETARSIGQLHGQQISLHQVDVADRLQMEQLPEAVLHAHGRVDLLINNAGVYVAGAFEHYSLADLEWTMGVNFWGMIYGCRAFLPALRRTQRGWIATMLSDFGLVGLAGKTAYCATKFAARGFSEALRGEIYGTGVGVTCIYPSAVNTGLIRNARAVNAVKRDAEARFVATRSLPAAVVAERALRGIEREKARVLIGRDTLLLDALARIAPGLTNTLLGRLRDRLAFL